MRLAYLCAALAFGCGSKASGSGDDAPPTDAKPPTDGSGDPCVIDPANCPTDDGLFVSVALGSDTNPGTRTMPLKTISAALTKAKAMGGPRSIYVGQSVYAEKVTLAKDVSLNGGYECNANQCTWVRDLITFETLIMNQDFEGVLAGPGLGPTALIGGFTIRGKDGTPTAAPGSVALTIAGSAPTVRGNKIIAGNVTGNGGPTASDRSIGIALRGSGNTASIIENNVITGGTGVGLSAGITLEAVGGVVSSALVTSNVVKSGAARRSVGIAAFGSGPTTIISNNDVTTGNSSGGASHGIELTSSGAITKNRINADDTMTGTCTNQTQWCAGIVTNGATASITNNVVYGPKGFRTAGVFMTETEVPTGAVVLNSNYINGGGAGGSSGVTTRNTSAAIVVSIGICNTCGLKGAVGRVRNNILDGGINLDRFGVREDPAQGKTTSVELLDSNDIWFESQQFGRNDTLYREVSSSGTPIDTKSIGQLDGWTSPPTMDNLNEDPVRDATWHLHSNSPCIDSGTSTEAPAKDFDDDSRPQGNGVDIGPDEAE